MSLVSPLQVSKPTISIPSSFNVNDETTMDDKQPIQYLNEYTLFLLLERQRNTKLRELYHSRSFVDPKKSEQSHEVDIALPKCPVRYKCLRLSVQGLVMTINKLRRDPSLRSSTKEQWKALDRATMRLLEDTVNILKDRLDGSSSRTLLEFGPGARPRTEFQRTRCSTPAFIPSRTITPPPSPSTLPLAASGDYLSPRGRQDEVRRNEVNMSDDEILTLWNRATPSVVGVDFDVFRNHREREQM